MFKNVLVISDNPYLCSKFSEMIINKKIENCFFSFSISPFSRREDFLFSETVTINVLDLREKKDIDFIVTNYDLVISIHCKQIFPESLVKIIKCINVHPGYNPINRGWYPQVFSIINKEPIGATIHEMDEKLDHGLIIAREFVEKTVFDTSETLYQKVVEKEIELLEKYLEKIISKEYKTIVPEKEGQLYLKKDFNDLLKIDLQEQILIGDFIDKLRALTHGDFKNAFFIDSVTGKKIFISVNLIPEDK